MIRIHRGREPVGLNSARNRELARIRLIAVARSPSKTEIGTSYSVVKDGLCEAQFYKCCYCERNNLEPAFLPVEHYRPKSKANRGPGFPDHGYWWLAWTWKNLLFSCQPCNSSHKGVKFPLAAGSVALMPEQPPPGTELPLLIDPASEEPISHIKFTFHPKLARHRWRPLPRNGSAKGDQSIRDLGLDRPALLDLYEKHVDDHIKPIANRLSTLVRLGQAPAITRVWGDEVLGWLNAGRPFTGLSYDAFDHYIPVGVRRQWRLGLPRPR